MNHRSYLLACLPLLLMATPARAEFLLSEVIIDFLDGAARQHDIEVISKDNETQYIDTETYLVENPTAPDEKRTQIANPQESGLMVTPNKMALAAGARKLMRFLLLKPQTDKDQIYRVAVKPVIQGVDAGDQKVALKVLVGYEALVIVRPKNPKIELTAQRKGNSLTIINKGNTNANLQSGQQCDNTGGECKELSVARIYAGQSWTTTLPHLDGEAKYQVWNGIKMENIIF